MSNKWQYIWSKKNLSKYDKLDLESLIKIDGFDTGVGSYTTKAWKIMVRDMCNRFGLKECSNVMEIGCGGGAFIYAANDIVKANWYGVDYSGNLINIAKKAIPRGHFILDEAINTNFTDTKFDVVFSHSVFQYFPSELYAENVLRNWCAKIKRNGCLALLDINDFDKQQIYHLERAKNYNSPDEYAKAFRDLNHLFFRKEKLSTLLKSIRMSNIEFFPHATPDYGNSKFRFNLICRKN